MSIVPPADIALLYHSPVIQAEEMAPWSTLSTFTLVGKRAPDIEGFYTTLVHISLAK